MTDTELTREQLATLLDESGGRATQEELEAALDGRDIAPEDPGTAIADAIDAGLLEPAAVGRDGPNLAVGVFAEEVVDAVNRRWDRPDQRLAALFAAFFQPTGRPVTTEATGWCRGRNYMCDTRRTGMSTDTDDAGDRDRMEKIDVRVPGEILDAIDEEYSRRGYATRSAAIRDALRDWLNPSPELSKEILAALEDSRDQRERGETVSAAEARERLGIDDAGE